MMTYGADGNYDAAYTYGNERIEVEDLDETRPESQDPLYYLYDGLGSVAYMVKPDGNMRDHYRYDEYGKPAPGNSKQSPDGDINLNNTFGYTGEMWDEESDLLYLRARYYEPETGRFLSRDTYEGDLENPLSKNLYLYVENKPLNAVDPSGHTLLPLAMNMWGEDVRELQLRLMNKGFFTLGWASGYFGPNTFQAVNQYKASRGLGNSYSHYGIVGNYTWRKLVSESKIPNLKGKVIVLNASEAVDLPGLDSKGHEAIVLVKSNGNATYFSYSPGDKVFTADTKENTDKKPLPFVNANAKKIVGWINDNVRRPQKYAIYDRHFEIDYFSDDLIQKMQNFAEQDFGPYGFVVNNCLDFATDVLRAGKLWVPEGVVPNNWHLEMDAHYGNIKNYLFD